MANQEHLDILKRGEEVWNQWRKEHTDIQPDLSRANLRGTIFIGVNLEGTDLRDAILFRASFLRANLAYITLSGASLYEADLKGAILSGANLYGADLSGANLCKAEVAWTLFTDMDLSKVEGLEAVQHYGPSSIGIDTIIRSQGKIPDIFLRNAGVPNSIIEIIPSLVGSLKPIDFYSCFISCSSKDQSFAERL